MEFSLLETMRLDEGAIVRFERHLARLTGFGAPLRLRTTTSPDSIGDRGDRSRASTRDLARPAARRIATARQRSSARRTRLTAALASGVCVGSPVDSQILSRQQDHAPPRARHGAARAPDVDDVILWNERGEVTEATIANVVAEIDGVRYTPPLTCGLLGGTFRAELLASDRIRERVLTRDRRAQRIEAVADQQRP